MGSSILATFAPTVTLSEVEVAMQQLLIDFGTRYIPCKTQQIGTVEDRIASIIRLIHLDVLKKLAFEFADFIAIGGLVSAIDHTFRIKIRVTVFNNLPWGERNIG